jgi:hypothetical protein
MIPDSLLLSSLAAFVSFAPAAQPLDDKKLPDCTRSILPGSSFRDLGQASSAAASHEQVRSASGFALPRRPWLLALHGSAAHHSSFDWSLIIVRRRDGSLWLDGLDRRGGGLLPASTTTRKFAGVLMPEETKAIEAAVGDQCLGSEPAASWDSNIVAGAATMTLETFGSSSLLKVRVGDHPDRTGKLIDLVHSVAERIKSSSDDKVDLKVRP